MPDFTNTYKHILVQVKRLKGGTNFVIIEGRVRSLLLGSVLECVHAKTAGRNSKILMTVVEEPLM
jgi:hypothetical protein